MASGAAPLMGPRSWSGRTGSEALLRARRNCGVLAGGPERLTRCADGVGGRADAAGLSPRLPYRRSVQLDDDLVAERGLEELPAEGTGRPDVLARPADDHEGACGVLQAADVVADHVAVGRDQGPEAVGIPLGAGHRAGAGRGADRLALVEGGERVVPDQHVAGLLAAARPGVQLAALVGEVEDGEGLAGHGAAKRCRD